MKVIKLYKALEEVDKTEGKGGCVVIGYFATRPVAEMAAGGKGAWGRDGEVYEVSAIDAGDGRAYLLASEAPVTICRTVDDGLRHSALSKLTYAEARALGVCK